ncbi:hypothetical protein EPUS_00218 [Endocarpon pusillum Z07020]|uniref:Uncharacterized protein n=1 Tax=Endocarpon pusillum (strain Z07020 / HMAS-L-300199) TaxID=1263415 RepID=U1HX82_ENDPU|nr:uncharacterized protein EPUS_00218 [Endocarpon pusillum Z07020]ERF75425.1 hypothetical protein EPUS_00218 [Endocarpon pusillum Z07020]
MCRTFTFYHLCGHIHHNHTISCPSPVPFTSSPPPSHSPSPPHPDIRILSPSPSCAIVVNEPHHYPTLCNSCKAVGIISDWFAKSPHARIEAIMEWRKREDGNLSRTRASSTPPANALHVLDLGDASRGPVADDGEELEEMPLIEPEGLCSNSNREGESEGEKWIQSNAEGWIRSASSASSARTVLRVDSSVSVSSTLSLGRSQPSSSSSEEAQDRSKWPQWLLEQSISTITDLQNDATALADWASSQTSIGPSTRAPARGRAPPAPAPAPVPVASVSTNPRNAATTRISHTTTDLKMNTDKSQGARSRLPVPTAPAATVAKGKETEKRRSLLPVPRAVSQVGKRGVW